MLRTLLGSARELARARARRQVIRAFYNVARRLRGKDPLSSIARGERSQAIRLTEESINSFASIKYACLSV